MTGTTPPVERPEPAPATTAKTSGLAITGLVLGIVGFCTMGLTGLVGLVFAIIALMQIGQRPDEVGGRGVAIWAVVLSLVSMLAAPVFLSIGLLLPALGSARQAARAAMADANLRQVASATTLYAADWDNRLPPADDWIDLLRNDYLAQIDTLLLWPGDEPLGRAFAFNAKLAGVRLPDIDEPDRTVLLFEVAFGRPVSGGPELLAPKPRSFDGYAVVFVDGHTEHWPRELMDELIWDPNE